MLVVTLAQCGDIQTNPGPIRNKLQNKVNKTRKYTSKYPCSSCHRGIRNRPVICYGCQSLTHSKCITGLTNDIYDSVYRNNEIIVYKCVYCSDTKSSVIRGVIEVPPAPLLPSSSQDVVALPPPRAAADKCTNTTDASGTHRRNSDESENNNTHTQEKYNVICKHCQKSIKAANKKRSCNNCESMYHPRCFKRVSINDNLCNICLSQQLPFHTFNEDSEFDIIILEQSLINPSEMPDSAYNCFRRRGLHLIHINARSLPGKIEEIRILAKKANPAILSVTETWFDKSITDNCVKIPNYNIIRRDRLTSNRSGGVCMYIRSDLAYNQRNELENDDLEDIWLELLLPKSKPIVIGTCYRAPKINKIMDCLESTMSKLQPDYVTIILGDLNI